jgi:hypothetical protein
MRRTLCWTKLHYRANDEGRKEGFPVFGSKVLITPFAEKWKRAHPTATVYVGPLVLVSHRPGEYADFEVIMFTALCVGCVCVFVFGTAIRFAILAGWLGRTGVLPENWWRWMYDTKSTNPKQ